MIQMPCPACGKPLPVGGCSDCGEILICFFCGWPDRQSQPVRSEAFRSSGWDQDRLATADAA
ncbi:MAG: hypothetical protein ABIH23_02690 [bacterium]